MVEPMYESVAPPVARGNGAYSLTEKGRAAAEDAGVEGGLRSDILSALLDGNLTQSQIITKMSDEYHRWDIEQTIKKLSSGGYISSR